MGLDTLPLVGRVLLFAFLLAALFSLLTRVISNNPSRSMHILYRKGALVMLLVLPILLGLLNVQLPVHVPEVRSFSTRVPGSIAYAVLVLWLLVSIPPAWRLWRRFATSRATLAELPRIEESSGEKSARKLVSRLVHWQKRLSLSGDYRLARNSGQIAWHEGRTLALPRACLNWPTGLIDVVLLVQLAQLKQSNWKWLVYAEIMRVVYWPAPWVGRMVDELIALLPDASIQLARAAYRDADGWRRDMQGLLQRYENLGAPSQVHFSLPVPSLAAALAPGVRAGSADIHIGDARPNDHNDEFNSKWQRAKLKRALKHFDPYERAYWLIAVATLVVGVATTMTVVREPPEFEPGFLEVKWRDQMGRRLTDQDPNPAPDPRRAARPSETVQSSD